MPLPDEIVKRRAVLSVPGMDRVCVRKDEVYRTVDEGSLKMDVYAPPGPPARRPAVVLVHGGPVPEGAPTKELGIFVSTGELLAASGFVAVTFNHRFYGPARLKDAASDVAEAVRHVRGQARTLGLDPDRVALWAYSGGGPFLAPWLRERPAFLRALVAYYAILDLQVPPPGESGEVDFETRRAFSAVAQLSGVEAKAPPMLVARAGQDHPWLNGSIDRFVQEALGREVTLDLLTHPSGRHGFDLLDDDARSRDILARTIEFLKLHLQAPRA